MDARELRIGNWVMGDNGPIQIEPNSFQNVFNGSYDLEPIALAEDWLVKFGFEKGNDTKLPWSISFHMPNKSSEEEVIFMPDDDGNWFLSNTGGEGDVIQFIGKPFKYVHQLQNLYFALTGSELAIKQP